MAVKHEVQELRQAADLLVAPLYSLEAERIPRHTLTEDEMPPDVAYQIVHDELMLDGNARLNLATFVTTWMEPQAEQLMAECLDKNMIDKDEYPQTAALETRCVEHARQPLARAGREQATGCSTTGSSEAAMLGGLALKRRWQQAAAGRREAGRQAEPRDGHQRPGLLGEVRQLLGRRDAPRADGGRPLPPLGRGGRGAAATRTRSASSRILGSTFDGSYEPVAEICAALDDLRAGTRHRRAGARRRRLGRVRRAVPRSGSRVGLPSAARRLDQHVGPQVRARLPRRRLDRLARRRRRCPTS